MKRIIWLVAGLICLGPSAEAPAQFLPGYGGASYGVGFRYNSGRLSVGGFFSRNYAPGFLVAPYGPPAGVIQTRVVERVYAPPTIIVLPERDQYALPERGPYRYDVTGVDLDLVQPPQRIGPNGLAPMPKEPEPAPEIPGKDVSVPKKPVRPNGPKQPPPPAPPPGQLPKPPGPLPDPKDEANRQIVEGVAAFQNQDYGVAVQRFQQAIDSDPANPLGWFLRSQAEFALGHYKDAVASIHEGMKRRPDWPQAKFQPRLQLYKGNEPAFDEHLQRLDEVIKQNPQSADFLFLAGHQRWFDNNRPEALKLFQQARPLAVNPIYIDRFLNAGPAKVVQK